MLITFAIIIAILMWILFSSGTNHAEHLEKLTDRADKQDLKISNLQKKLEHLESGIARIGNDVGTVQQGRTR